MTTDSVTTAIEQWLDAMVVGLNLCPFAKAARRRGLVRIAVASGSTQLHCLQELADEAAQLQLADDEATTLFVLPQGFDDFDQYLDLLAISEALLADLDLEGVLQLASFHPLYQFDGTEIDDVSNWTNRAPYPILHLLKEEGLSVAIDAHPDPEGIPARNILKLEELGLAGVRNLLVTH